jgi:inner membrane protein
MGIEEDAEFIFKFYIKNDEGKLSIQQSGESRNIERGAFTKFINRIKGI